jgi:hypothetical protein
VGRWGCGPGSEVRVGPHIFPITVKRLLLLLRPDVNMNLILVGFHEWYGGRLEAGLFSARLSVGEVMVGCAS